MRDRVRPKNPYKPLPITSQPENRVRDTDRMRERMDRLNSWCKDLMDAVAIEYFPILVVGFVVLALVVVAVIGAVGLMDAVGW